MESCKQPPPDIEAKVTHPHKRREIIQRSQHECHQLDTASISPVRKCPHELLVMIFKYYLVNKPSLIRHLLLVCKTWHVIAVGTPSFWTKIFINLETKDEVKAIRPRIEASLLHSQPLLLDIRLDFRRLFPGHASWNASHILPFLESFVGSMARWKTLDVLFLHDRHVDPCTSILGLFVGPTPHLTKLSLSVYTPLRFSKRIFPVLSSLKSLDINFVELLNLINAPFSSLENLSMACSYSAEFQSARLHRFASLTTLTIQPSLGFYVNDSISTTVALPSLKQIKFRGIIPSRRVQFDLPLLSNLHIEYMQFDFLAIPPIMSPRSVILFSMQRCLGTSHTLEAIIRQYGSIETLSVSECMEADLKVIVEKLRRQGSLSRKFNLVRVMSDGFQGTELRVWQI